MTNLKARLSRLLCETLLPSECLTLWNRTLSCSVQPVLWGKTVCVQQHDEIAPAWLLNLYCGVPSEAACAQGSQLSSLLPQTGILSTWQTSRSGALLKSHDVIKKKYLCPNYSAHFHSFPLSLPSEMGEGGCRSDFLVGGAKLRCGGCYTDLGEAQLW